MVRINFDRMVRRSFDGEEREVDVLEPEDVESTIKLRKAFKAFQYGNNRGLVHNHHRLINGVINCLLKRF